MNLKGKVALITGGGSGIGAAIAKRFVADGAKVCITGRREQYLDKVIETLPSGTAAKCSGDVSKPEDIERMVKAALDFGDEINVLVNCAGLSPAGSITDVEIDEWKKTIEVNLFGPFLLMRAVLPHMIKAGGGSVINISSLASMRCIPKSSAYCASKAALNMLTQQAALDYGQYKIRCNAVCPGFVFTDITEGHFGKLAKKLGIDTESLVTNAFKEVPLRYPAVADEISGICSFLASDDSSYMTGTVIPVDGGTAIVDVFPAGLRRAISELKR